ncbi:MAG: hypothetical protein JST59_27920 [Actinobacteria bacterium]|nr:hypothetical protein [Actinomycetota bacterium]
MSKNMRLVRHLFGIAVLIALLAPAGASGATFNFFSTDGLGPSGGAGTIGPATSYPSSIEVAGLEGPLTKVTATMLHFGSGSPDDVDMLLVGPEGEQVLLMSDACGEAQFFTNSTWTFDDDAPSFLPDNGPCASNQAASFKPSNYVGSAPEPDQFGAGGGIFPPYDSTLSAFAGTDPNGPWDLFVRDDHEGVVGFEISGWALTLTVADPPPASPPASPPATGTTTPAAVAAPSGSQAPTAQPRATGRRAAALKRCKAKKTKAKRVKCRAKARKLPV